MLAVEVGSLSGVSTGTVLHITHGRLGSQHAAYHWEAKKRRKEEERCYLAIGIEEILDVFEEVGVHDRSPAQHCMSRRGSRGVTGLE